ncbi:MAG: rhodanese-like domain-containing protein [Fodinibius sp.]|nr:rhodanese-like domain-containing protein [Fodinibius sp.]
MDTRKPEFFMDGHLKGSLLTTFDNSFNTIAGSYIGADEDLFLIIDEQNIDQAVRDLVRVGLDNIKGYATPQMLSNWDHDLEVTPTIDFEDVEELRKQDNMLVLDVRKATEYTEGHIPDALNIAHTRLADNLDELPREKTLLVHCAGGTRASYASGLLEKNGFNVQWVDDDFENWEQRFGKSEAPTTAE